MNTALLLGCCIGLALHGVTAMASEPPVPVADPETAPPAPASASNPVIVIESSLGTMRAELWPDKAPKTVANFLAYVDDGFFDGLIFHRVIPNFMIQGGGFTPEMTRKPTRAPIANEARADTPNARGTLAMARTMDVNSATGQFFINLVDNAFLNHKNKTPNGFGYCVFGKVIDGMDAVDRIGATPTGSKGPYRDVPREPVVIKSIRRAEAGKPGTPEDS